MDTGVRHTHEALAARYRGVVAPPDRTFTITTGMTASSTSGTPIDQNSHGTHTMGTAVGNQLSGSPYGNIGVAKGAMWTTVRICGLNGSNSCDDTAIMRGFQWTAPTRVGGLSTRGPTSVPVYPTTVGVVPGCDATYNTAVQNWVNAGIFPDFSTGNSGPGAGTVGTPASAPPHRARATSIPPGSGYRRVIATSSGGPSPATAPSGRTR